MRVIVRADASSSIGSGHVMRCLTVADALAAEEARVEFVCRETDGNLIEYIEAQRGFRTHRLPRETSPEQDAVGTAAFAQQGERPAWLVVDHYGLDHVWEREQRSSVNRILAIDDLADRLHDCDLLLDQNYNEFRNRYEHLVPATCTILLGPQFALLRPEFATIRANTSPRTGTPRRILVSFGGSDPTGETIKVLDQFQQTTNPEKFSIACVVGAGNARLAEVGAMVEAMPNVELYVQTTEMARLISEAEIGVGAGGSTIWERFCLGLPTLTAAVAEHQERACKLLARLGYLYYAGNPNLVKIDYVELLDQVINDVEGRLAMSQDIMAIVDGLGVHRVITRMAS